MLIHPLPDPIALAIGPLAIRWYGLMYLAAFVQFLILGRLRLRQPHIAAAGWRTTDIDDLLFYGVLGVVIGGRLGEVLFYHPGYYLDNPDEIIAIWKGGMSFHGGFLGVLVAMWIWARLHGRRWMAVMDFIAPLVPLGYAFGRIGNFINAELPGRVADADLPWAMIWPNVDALPRHPSPIYQALIDGCYLFCCGCSHATHAPISLLAACSQRAMAAHDFSLNFSGCPTTKSPSDTGYSLPARCYHFR
jgi:phosphatidylglycerol:prolipoprotein diacylglycerol transferase